MKSSKWIYIGALGFLASVGLSILFFFHSRELFGSSLSIIYFIILFPLAISSAVFLFKVLESYASFTGKYLGNELKLGGPVVVFCLVFAGGFYFYQHPPSPGTYTFSISFMDSTNMSNILKGSANITYGNEVNVTHVLQNGAVEIKDAIPGKEIMIIPGIPGYVNKTRNMHNVPYPPDILQIYMYEDTFVLDSIRKLHEQISKVLNNYVNDAKDFRDLLRDDSALYINNLDSALAELNITIRRYAESYTTLFTLKNSLTNANRKLLAVDTVTLHKAFEDFDYVHQKLFKAFDLKVRPLLTEYYDTHKIETRQRINDLIAEELSITSDRMSDLDKTAEGIQNSLNL